MEETFPLPEWSVEAHLKFMDGAGIGQSVLSMPAPQPWFGDAEECCRAIRSYNESYARLKARYTGRFLFCASLPLPDVDAAVREAIYEYPSETTRAVINLIARNVPHVIHK